MPGGLVTMKSIRASDIRERHLVLLSGGPDSAALAFWTLKKGYSIECLYLDYAQGRKNRERECAHSIANRLGVNLTVLETPLTSDLLGCITSSHTNNAHIFVNVVNMCTMAAAFALNSGIKTVAIGINTDDVQLHPALQTKFFRIIEELTSIWMDNKLRILTPFLNKDKSTVMRIGMKLSVPFESTWSCGVNVDKHCGRCSECLARKEAFKVVGLPDHTEYEYEL